MRVREKCLTISNKLKGERKHTSQGSTRYSLRPKHKVNTLQDIYKYIELKPQVRISHSRWSRHKPHRLEPLNQSGLDETASKSVIIGNNSLVDNELFEPDQSKRQSRDEPSNVVSTQASGHQTSSRVVDSSHNLQVEPVIKLPRTAYDVDQPMKSESVNAYAI